MGRIKTTLTKRTAIAIFNSNPKAFKEDFESNKKIVSSMIETSSKKLRNIIAGYVTRLAQKKD
ncbi:30S ribosomal protein S17e [Candidatus Woesearchaeota archaeon]|nr:30S ribosomal protein S17e [Candidatus Woesearchaeota archaeon]